MTLRMSDKRTAIDPRVPQEVLDRFDGPHQEVWLFANNPRLADLPLDDLPIGARSLVVQFNRAVCFEQLAAFDCFKDFLFTAAGASYHGFDAVGHPTPPLAQQVCRRLRIGLLGGEPEPHMRHLRARFPEAGWLNTPFGVVVMRGYPRRLVASSGFVVVQVHLAIEAARVAAGLPCRDIHLVGFTGYGPSSWRGHDWWLEQKVLRIAPTQFHADEARAPWHRLRAVRWWAHHQFALRHGRKS